MLEAWQRTLRTVHLTSSCYFRLIYGWIAYGRVDVPAVHLKDVINCIFKLLRPRVIAYELFHSAITLQLLGIRYQRSSANGRDLVVWAQLDNIFRSWRGGQVREILGYRKSGRNYPCKIKQLKLLDCAATYSVFCTTYCIRSPCKSIAGCTAQRAWQTVYSFPACQIATSTMEWMSNWKSDISSKQHNLSD